MEKEQFVSKNLILSAMFLVAGTAIGGGMLALPVATGLSGFIPSMFVMLLTWMAMTASALLLLEISLWMEEGVHIITMASRLLGPVGKFVCWILYLFVCYASLTGYTAAGGFQFAEVFTYLGYPISKELGSLLFVLAFGFLIDLGVTFIGRLNTVLFAAMVIAYLALVGMGIDEVKLVQLSVRRWAYAWLAIPLLLTTFSFHTMVPSLPAYLKRQAKPLRIAIIGGTTITFLIYALWQWLILGIVPIEGPSGLAEALYHGESPVVFLKQHVNGEWIGSVAEYFAFFAIITSFIGIAFGLFDFLADGLKVKKEGSGKLLLATLIVVPTLVFATQFERIFIVAMETSGGFGDAILNGMIPVMMVWVSRYKLGHTQAPQVFGGKPILVAIFCFFLVSLIMEVLAHTGYASSLNSAYEVMKYHDIEQAIEQ